MKKYFTLLLLFSVCLKLSAYTHHPGNVKFSAHKNKKTPADTTLKEGLNLNPTVTHNSNDLRLFAGGVHQGSLKITGLTRKEITGTPVATQKEVVRPQVRTRRINLYATNLLHNSDRLKLFASAKHSDSLKAHYYSHNSDSLRLYTSLVGKGSNIRFSDYVVHNDSLIGPMATVNLAALANHADSLAKENGEEPEEIMSEAVKISNDSLRLIALLLRMDTVKSPWYKHRLDSLKAVWKTTTLDSVKQELQVTTSDLFKAPIYTEIAKRYLDYDTISNNRRRAYYQFEAVNYTMLALHRYSTFNDTAGMRTCFNSLSTVYIAQKKYSEAKWFTLQSIMLSRATRDVPNLIYSLVRLASIKSDIKDYNLAMSDLNEAMQLATNAHMPKAQSYILKNYGLLYSRMQNYDKEASVLKRRDSIELAMQKDEENRLARELAQAKKVDSLQTKKKVFTSNTKKLSKSSSAKKTTSL